ncbi:deoxyribonuclease IV [Caproiciproducens sp. NJN-50]|uniref:deoxyribonuclease IV n=1 Tax=Acutalibacteraceae TaxID=3082771 RepID=UPI000FFE2BD3|nr:MULTISPECIES: deoxyribonuclease IV [Acutalibacteraceae]QAT48318.1 deoxyribonuclease IV [Caproiciproducens sp. NJN-50]
MLKIGCHLSAAKGYASMCRDALSIGANTFQFFTRNPRGGRARALDPKDENQFLQLMRENNIGPVVAHAPYTMNVCSADEKVRAFGCSVLADDLARMERLPGNCYNLHPGSHGGQGAEEGIRMIAGALNEILTPEMHTTVLLETMAGKGSEVGRSFEELRAILDRVECSERIGVCLDTCHIFDAGYDIVGDPDGVLGEFDRAVGLSRLRAVHLNDSKNPIGSRKDRHERIGEGRIGFDALLRFARHPAVRDLPLILETPNDLSGHGREIAAISAAWKTSGNP